jgi:hypothetical protein
LNDPGARGNFRGVSSRQVELEPQVGRALCRSASFDPKTLQVDLQLTTGERVLRDGWDGPYYEELGLDDGELRMGRLASGRLNLLDNHGYVDGAYGPSRFASKNVRGVVIPGTARVEQLSTGEKAVVARFQLSDREELAGYRKDVASGVLAQCSAGYRVYKMEVVERTAGAPPVMRATDWEITEVSITACPAESEAYVRTRGDEQKKNRCELVELADNKDGTRTMKKNEQKPDAPATTEVRTDGAPAGDGTQAPASAEATRVATLERPAADDDQVRAAEQKRVLDVQKFGKRFGLSEAAIAGVIQSTRTYDEARLKVAELYPGSTPEVAEQPVATRVTETQRAGEDEAIQTALIHRSLPHLVKEDKLTDQARFFRSYSLLDLCRHFVERQGKNWKGLSKSDLVERAMLSSSDFPELLAGTVNKTLRDQYQSMPNTWRPWCRKASVPDFKTNSRVQTSGAPSLLEVPENGEITRGKITDAAEKYALKTYGKIVMITRKALINDDLSAFMRIPSDFAISASVLIEDLVYAILTSNPNMADTFALFGGTGHNNNGTGSPGSSLSTGGLSTARARMRAQKSIEGKYLNLSPRFLIVPAALETVAQQNTVLINAVTAGGVNPFMGLLEVIVQPRLDGATNGLTSWYLSADPTFIDTIEVGFLEGNEGPRIESQLSFESEGMEIKCVLDVGTKAIDYRGLDRSVGA